MKKITVLLIITAILFPGLIVTPPAGLEVGYVPIVTSQEIVSQGK